MIFGKTRLPNLPPLAKARGIFRPEHGYLAAAGVIFLLIALAIHLVADSQRHVLDQKLRNAALEHATNAAARLEAEISSNIFLANGLAAYVSQEDTPNPDDLRSAMRALTGLGKHLRNIGIAVGYTLTYVYPEEGNKEAIGLYYPDVPDQWPDVKKAITAKSTVVAGPLELAQGGQGIISRTPVFTEEGTYWGILSLVLDAHSVFEGAGLTSSSSGYLVALRTRNQASAPSKVVFGDPSVFTADPVTTEIVLPGNQWELGLTPIDGWSANHRVIDLAESLLVAFAAGFAVFLFIFLRNRNQLHVREREITAILNTSREGIVVLDAEDKVLEANAAACAMFTQDVSALRGRPVSTIIDFNRDLAKELTEFASTLRDESDEDDTLRATGLCARRGEFPLEVRVGQAQTAGRFLLVCALRDISADMNYERKLIELATIDPLTKAFNRRSFFAQGEKAAKLAKRHGRDISLLLLDADHFKSINDTYGHAAGDEVLAALGTLIRDNIRSTDIFGRIGGEEFALLLPETEADAANILAEKLNQSVASLGVEASGDRVIRFTVSIGVASSNNRDYDFRAMLQAADQALYRAKREGRNRYAI